MGGYGGKISVTETVASGLPVKLGNDSANDNYFFIAQGSGLGSANGTVTITTQDPILLTTDANGNVLGASGSAIIGLADGATNGGGGALVLVAPSITSTATATTIFNASGTGTGIWWQYKTYGY